ncbi:MAG: transcriptional regulator NrdR [Treponema sp.]|nr:transcriptional regulator NrdR [Treponema sp.]
MRCPHCGNFDDKVIESRTLANGEAIRRRRECTCGYRFTSYERIEDKPFMVVKRDGRREPFDRLKIEKGVKRALEKRPVSSMQIESLVNDVEDQAEILGRVSHEINSKKLGDLVLTKIGEMDKVAYVRFASVYRHFENPDEFVREIKKLGTGEEV